MWSMKKKGAKPHYKPGTDEKKKKYQKVDESKTIRSKEDAEKNFLDMFDVEISILEQ